MRWTVGRPRRALFTSRAKEPLEREFMLREERRESQKLDLRIMAQCGGSGDVDSTTQNDLYPAPLD